MNPLKPAGVRCKYSDIEMSKGADFYGSGVSKEFVPYDQSCTHAVFIGPKQYEIPEEQCNCLTCQDAGRRYVGRSAYPLFYCWTDNPLDGYYMAGCQQFNYEEAVEHWGDPNHSWPKRARLFLDAVEKHHKEPIASTSAREDSDLPEPEPWW